MLANLDDLLSQAETMAADLGEAFDPHNRLRDVLQAAGIANHYDTIIVDPPATTGPHLYNAITATRSLVLPIEPTGKGIQSVAGLEDIVTNLASELGFDVGVLAVVPNGIGRTVDQRQYVDQFRELGYEMPVIIRDRSSLFEGCWDKQCTAFEYVDAYRSQKREYELETLEKVQTLGDHIAEVGDQ